MAKILIVGGTGFIGAQIARQLLNLNHQVICYDNFLHFGNPLENRYEFYLRHRMEQIKDQVVIERGDTRNREAIRGCMERHKPEYIIHLAAIADATVALRYPQDTNDINVVGTLNLLGLLKEFPVKRFLFTSSSFVYGNFQYLPADENHPLSPFGIYGGTKLTGEVLTKSFCKEYGLEYVIIRPSAVYGFGDSHNRVTKTFMENAIFNRPLKLVNGGEYVVDFSYVTDVADGFVRALFAEKAKNEIFNISRGEGRSIAELAEIVKSHFPHVPMIEESEKPDMKRPLRGALGIEKARTLLGYNPTVSLEDGIKIYAAPMKNCQPLLQF